MTFTDDECYLLFLALDNQARRCRGTEPEVNALREKLMPIYSAWHHEHPFKVHPSARAAKP